MAKEYIERETIIDQIVNTTSEAVKKAFEHKEYDFSSTLDRIADRQHEILNFIIEAPAADVAPMVHGRWIIHTEHFAPYQQCSVCGFEIPVIATENELDIGLFRYRPNCGCRMDLEG